MFFKLSLVGGFLAIGFAHGLQDQAGDQLTAREMYYRETSKDEKLPPLPSQPPQKKPVNQPAAKKAGTGPQTVGAATAQPVSSKGHPATVAAVPVAEHFGLRYRLLLVDKNTNQSNPVNVESIFHKGECLALELEPNRAGYLYVLAKESSGNWHPLFPSSEMDDESEVVHGHSKQRVPQKYCFELDEDIGEEHLYVVLSRNPEQVQTLHLALLKNQPGGPLPAQSANQAIIADSTVLDREANSMVAQLGSRGFKVAKVGASESAEEKYSVFVVPASLEKKDTVFADILIKHQ